MQYQNQPKTPGQEDKVGKKIMNTKVSSYEIKKGASINSIKRIVMRAGSFRKATDASGNVIRNRQTQEWFSDEQLFANEIVHLVKEGNFGFASEIATSVEKFGRISEKQAYWIARAAWENELPYIFSEEDGFAHEIFAA